jgi:uncharacterized protein (TIGR03382 family)
MAGWANALRSYSTKVPASIRSGSKDRTPIRSISPTTGSGSSGSKKDAGGCNAAGGGVGGVGAILVALLGLYARRRRATRS